MADMGADLNIEVASETIQFKNSPFRIREYVASIREKDPEKCWPFAPTCDYKDLRRKDSVAPAQQPVETITLFSLAVLQGPEAYESSELESPTGSQNATGMSPEIFRISSERARDYLLARRVKAGPGEYVLPGDIQRLAERIIEKDMQTTQGDWVPEAGEDPLIAMLGPEHPAVGHTVGLRKSLEKNDATPAAQSQRVCKSSSVGSSACFDWIHLLNFERPTECDLVLLCGEAKLVCAKGKAHPIGNGLIHGVQIKEGHVKVHVDLIIEGYGQIPLPVPVHSPDMKKLQDAHNTFIQWPQNAMVLHHVGK